MSPALRLTAAGIASVINGIADPRRPLSVIVRVTDMAGNEIEARSVTVRETSHGRVAEAVFETLSDQFGESSLRPLLEDALALSLADEAEERAQMDLEEWLDTEAVLATDGEAA